MGFLDDAWNGFKQVAGKKFDDIHEFITNDKYHTWLKGREDFLKPYRSSVMPFLAKGEKAHDYDLDFDEFKIIRFGQKEMVFAFSRGKDKPAANRKLVIGLHPCVDAADEADAHEMNTIQFINFQKKYLDYAGIIFGDDALVVALQTMHNAKNAWEQPDAIGMVNQLIVDLNLRGETDVNRVFLFAEGNACKGMFAIASSLAHRLAGVAGLEGEFDGFPTQNLGNITKYLYKVTALPAAAVVYTAAAEEAAKNPEAFFPLFDTTDAFDSKELMFKQLLKQPRRLYPRRIDWTLTGYECPPNCFYNLEIPQEVFRVGGYITMRHVHKNYVTVDSPDFTKAVVMLNKTHVERKTALNNIFILNFNRKDMCTVISYAFVTKNLNDKTIFDDPYLDHFSSHLFDSENPPK